MLSEEDIQSKTGPKPALTLAAEQAALPVIDGKARRSMWIERAFQSLVLVADVQPWYTGWFVQCPVWKEGDEEPGSEP